jgi:hypothetical protein
MKAEFIPHAENLLLQETVVGAMELAARGLVAEAYGYLTNGLQRAEAAVLEGHLWAPELHQRWQRSFFDFCTQHELPLPCN